MMRETPLYSPKSRFEAPRCTAVTTGDQHQRQPSVPTPQPLDVLLGMPVLEPAWVMPGLLPQGVTVLTGRRHTGKSGLALALALALACDTQVLGCSPTLPGEVLFLGLEASKHCLSGRVQKLLQGRTAPRGFEWAGSWTLLSERGLADIEDWLEQHPLARLVVIDTLDCIHPLPARLGGLFAGHHALMLPFQIMARAYGITILLLHHQCKEDVASELDTVFALLDCIMEIRQAHEGERGCRGGRPTTLLRIAGPMMEERDIVLTHEQAARQWRL